MRIRFVVPVLTVAFVGCTSTRSDVDWCMPFHTPPAWYDRTVVPEGVVYAELPLDRISAAARGARIGQAAEATMSGRRVLAASGTDPATGIATLLMPRRSDVPDACWKAILRHELAHLDGWTHP